MINRKPMNPREVGSTVGKVVLGGVLALAGKAVYDNYIPPSPVPAVATLQTPIPTPIPSTPPPEIKPSQAPIDPVKKQIQDWLQAFVDGRVNDVEALTPAAYRGYPDLVRQSMNGFLACRGRKIVDVSIVQTGNNFLGVGQLDQPCSSGAKDINGSPIIIREVNVWLFRVDGVLKPVKSAD